MLQDRMFEPTASWSLPEHLFQVSEWSANCTQHDDPGTCVNANLPKPRPPKGDPTSLWKQKDAPIYAWTDLTYLLHRQHVSWGYYVVAGTEPDCRDGANMDCPPVGQDDKTPGIWNPLPFFDTVRNDDQLGNIRPVNKFYKAASNGTLPAVSWVVPSGAVSEHPPKPISAGVAYVTGLVNPTTATGAHPSGTSRTTLINNSTASTTSPYVFIAYAVALLVFALACYVLVSFKRANTA